MSNLGGYQRIVEVVKALGGPTKAVVIAGSAAAVVGYGALRSVEAGVKKGVEVAKAAKGDRPCPAAGRVFTVNFDGGTGEGGGECPLKAGQEYRVLSCHGDAVLIEVLGASDNPHVVAESVLLKVSDFPADYGTG